MVNRKYKDDLFKLAFADKKHLLDLYNAINGTAYKDETLITVNTLKDAIYLGIKNDVSFIIDNTINLYEHQSTFNPNMPMRGLLYLAELYDAYAKTHQVDLYGTKLVKFPNPQYIVLYNGKDNVSDIERLKLSSCFEDTGKSPCIEMEVQVYNINRNHNLELMNNCKRLNEYSLFVDMVKENLISHDNREYAVDMAVDECIRQNILADILITNKAEVKSMLLYEYNEEEVRERMRQAAREEGLEEGLEQGLEQGLERGLEQGEKQAMAEAVDKLMSKKGMTLLEACTLLDVNVKDYKAFREGNISEIKHLKSLDQKQKNKQSR